MVSLIKVFFLISLFLTSRIIISKIIGKKKKKDIFEGINDISKDKSIISKYKESIKKIIIVICVFLVSLISGIGIKRAIFVCAMLYTFIYFFKYIKKNFYKKQVITDLLNMSECLRVQISSQIPLGNALRSLPELCENKELKELITNIYLEYELSKFIILDSAEALQSKFNYSEIRIFISALNQQMQGTSAIEAFDNLINILKEKYIEYLEESTKNKMAIMTLGVFGIVINIAALGIYPMVVEAFEAISSMLK